MAKKMSSADFELSWSLCPDKLSVIGINPFTKKGNCTKKMARLILVDGASITKVAASNWLISPDIRRLKALVRNLSAQILVRVGLSS
ncbi:hypothetical protein [Pseudomonas rossensis]|uniref:hypothetical protein n=1 Tax=Pseudomonas rossensis TaxID=2305471 RepID=UPI003260487A